MVEPEFPWFEFKKAFNLHVFYRGFLLAMQAQEEIRVALHRQ